MKFIGLQTGEPLVVDTTLCLVGVNGAAAAASSSGQQDDVDEGLSVADEAITFARQITETLRTKRRKLHTVFFEEGGPQLFLGDMAFGYDYAHVREYAELLAAHMKTRSYPCGTVRGVNAISRRKVMEFVLHNIPPGSASTLVVTHDGLHGIMEDLGLPHQYVTAGYCEATVL